MKDLIDTQPTLDLDRLRLRPVKHSDAGLMSLYAGDLRVSSMTRSIPHPLPPGAMDAFITTANAPDRTTDVWAMDGSKSALGELLGIISLTRLEPGKAEIGYWVAHAFWNAGFASEAVEGLLAANPQGLRTVFGSVFQSNAQSARVLTRAGFAYIGDAEAFSVAQGKSAPTWTYLKTLKA